MCDLVGFAYWGNFASCLFKKFSPGAADAAAGSWKSAAPLGRACGGSRGRGGFCKIF